RCGTTSWSGRTTSTMPIRFRDFGERGTVTSWGYSRPDDTSRGGKAMGTETMGKVVVTARIENLDDLALVHRGLLPAGQVRFVEVDDALVDTGATTLCLPKRLVGQLDLRPVRTRQARTSAGPVTLQMYGTVRLTVQDRDCVGDVVEIPD